MIQKSSSDLWGWYWVGKNKKKNTISAQKKEKLKNVGYLGSYLLGFRRICVDNTDTFCEPKKKAKRKNLGSFNY